MLTFAEALANALAQKINELETQIPENLQDTLQQLQNQLNEVYQKADVLEDFELGQVEEAIRQTLENLDAAGLFDSLCIEIGGGRYKLFSVIQTLASVDKVQKTEFLTDTEGHISGVRFTLTDGTQVLMNAQRAETDEDGDGTTDHLVITFSTDNWKGLQASFQCKYQIVRDTYTVLGQNIAHTEYEPMEATDIVFDLTGSLESCEPASPESVTPDLNQDGVIGTGEGTTSNENSEGESGESDGAVI